MDTTGSVTTHRQHTTRSQPTTSAPDSGVWDSNRHTRTGTQPTTDSGSVHEVLYGDAGVGDDDSVGAGDGDDHEQDAQAEPMSTTGGNKEAEPLAGSSAAASGSERIGSSEEVNCFSDCESDIGAFIL